MCLQNVTASMVQPATNWDLWMNILCLKAEDDPGPFADLALPLILYFGLNTQ